MVEHEHTQETGRRRDRWVIWLISLLFVAGLAIRGYGYITQVPSQSARRDLSSDQSLSTLRDMSRDGEQLKPFPESSPESDHFDLVNTLAPYLTEGGLSFFLGFCIGFFLRIVAKTVVFVVGGVYVALILLGHYGLVTVDWGSIQHILQQLLLNTRTQVEGLQGIMTVGLPSVALGCLGIWRGLKKS